MSDEMRQIISFLGTLFTGITLGMGIAYVCLKPYLRKDKSEDKQ